MEEANDLPEDRLRNERINLHLIGTKTSLETILFPKFPRKMFRGKRDKPITMYPRQIKTSTTLLFLSIVTPSGDRCFYADVHFMILWDL